VLLVLWLGRLKSTRMWTVDIAFVPTEVVSSEELFRHLLSANLAIIERDNFNQLGSSLRRKRVVSLLWRHWGVSSAQECMCAIEQRVQNLGFASLAERAAYAAWRTGERLDSEAFDALADTFKFLVMEFGFLRLRDIRPEHLTQMACDIQQLAYLARLGYSAGFLSRDRATEVLVHLQRQAQQHYGSWEDFSLSALIGMGMRCRLNAFDPGDWREIAHSHRILMTAERQTLSHAAPWLAKAEAMPSNSMAHRHLPALLTAAG